MAKVRVSLTPGIPIENFMLRRGKGFNVLA
jgi:hypothetical protein